MKTKLNLEITPIPCLADNYAYIVYDNISKSVGVIDPSESSPIISFLKKQNLKLNYILNTHHHFDHIGGNIESQVSILLLKIMKSGSLEIHK